MKKNQDQPGDAAELRRRAEERLKRQRPERGGRRTAEETARLVHELQVHQIELEMQNEELETSRAEVEAGLALYADLYDFAPAGYMTLDREGAIRQVNLTGARLLGVERSRLVNRRFGLFVAEEDRRVFSDFLDKVLASQTRECCELTLRPEESPPLLVQVEATRSADGQECRAAVLDITERKRAEEELRESEEQFRAMFQLASIGIAQADVRTGQWLRVNDKMCEITGYSADELAILRLSEVTHPEDRERDREAFQRLVRGEVPNYRLEKRYLRKDGTLVWVNVNMSVIHDAEGQPVRTIATIEDIAERKRAEEQTRELLAEVDASRQVLLSVVEDEKRAEAGLSQLNAELERRVFDRTAELTAANHELDAFAYAVSHDLRAPLRAMSGFSLAMLEDCGERLPEEARGFLNQIRQASHNMGQLIDGLLILSRSTRGELQRDRVDLSDLATRLCEELANAEPTRTVQWHVEDGLTAWGDVRMLEAVLANLLGNAWKYTAGCAAPSVRVYAEREGEQMFYCVADNGAGFDIRHANQLFKPFQRLHRQDEFPGIGIGLATVQRVVLRHGGTLNATAAVGQGATFRFSLPSAAETAEEAS